MRTYLIAMMATAILPTFVTAQDATDEGISFTYGAGVTGLSGVYVGQDDELLVFPVLAVSLGQWSLSFAKGIQFQAVQTATTDLSFALIYDPIFETPNTPLVAGLARKDGAAFEIEGSNDLGLFDISATLTQDVSERHEGLSADLSLGRSLMVGQTLVEGRVGASYLDEKSGTYLYGVAATEANTLRNAYAVAANWSPYVELTAIVPMNDTTSLVAGFRHEQLSDEISNSPLVETDERTTMGLSIIRTF